MTPQPLPFDRDVIIATVDVIGRSGARHFEIGYLNDEDDPAFKKHGAQWWAKAQYRGARISTEDHAGPIEACEALALKVLTGGRCKCGKLIRLGSLGAIAYDDVTMADGTVWTLREAIAAGQCRWRRRGQHWRRDCE